MERGEQVSERVKRLSYVSDDSEWVSKQSEGEKSYCDAVGKCVKLVKEVIKWASERINWLSKVSKFSESLL